MADEFKYDVFLSHSAKDRVVVRPIAEQLRKKGGLRVWFDDGDVEEALESSRTLVFCMSVNAFGEEWAGLESGTFRFRDPLNKERRFIPLRLDDAEITGWLSQFSYIDWRSKKPNYKKLIEACPGPAQSESVRRRAVPRVKPQSVTDLGNGPVYWWAFTPDGKRALSAGDDGTVRLWSADDGQLLRKFEGHKESVGSVAWSSDQKLMISGSDDKTVRLWDVETGRCVHVFEGHARQVVSAVMSTNRRWLLSGGKDRTLRLWDVETGVCKQVLEGHSGEVWSVAFGDDETLSVSGSDDSTIRLWDLEKGQPLRVFEGHTGPVRDVAWCVREHRVLSASYDGTVRLWDSYTGKCLRVLEGREASIYRVAGSDDGYYALSGSSHTVRLWDLEAGRCLAVLQSHANKVWGVRWSSDQRHAFSGDEAGGIRVWDLSRFIKERPPAEKAVSASTVPTQIQYTNAKVLLVGESGAGKTGLSRRLASNEWQPSDSTVGAWATQWKLPVDSGDDIEREIWLWDFGGQADQRLIHQLYMDETALAVLVFDGQKEDVFDTLGQWDRDLARASTKSFSKLLVAGRIDAGGLRVSRAQLEGFRSERGYLQLLETSAKTNAGCDQLRQAITEGIRWEDIPWRSSPLLFKRLKEEIIQLKDAGRVLVRFNELREALQLRLSAENIRFADAELKAVIGLLAGPGIVWELKFGHWVLLQPERINAYAQAVIQAMRDDEQERGCIAEERVLKGELKYHESIERLPADEERFVLLAMHQTLVERGLCLRQQTDKGALLVFPSYYRRERPELIGHPAVLVSYQFNGFLDDIYATLVVRLHHTGPFPQDVLWRYAADFKTLMGRQLGVKMTRRGEGAGELEVYFDPAIPMEEKIIFSKYVHEHLLQNGRDVVRLRHYVCPHCGTAVGNREVAMRKLVEGKEDIVCVNCEKRIPLWDRLEELFASDETKERVRRLQEQSAFVLDSESKERALVGEVISTVALAGQISREFNVSDHGIDMEIEFKSDDGEATGQKIYLQLKSGDSYLRERRGDGAEVFRIKEERHSRYWAEQAFPVLLVIRSAQGEVRWMEIRERLRRARKPVRQIVFDGERFDVMSVRRWRDRVLN